MTFEIPDRVQRELESARETLVEAEERSAERISAEAFEKRLGKFAGDAPATSRKAAVGIYFKSGTQRHRLLVEVEKAGTAGLTCDQAEAITGLPHQSASPRWNELWHEFAMIHETPRERLTRAGAKASVFVLTERGREALDRIGRE